MDGTHWQYCEGDYDITSSPTAEQDADEARWWTEDATCLVVLSRTEDGGWELSGSDVFDWVSAAETWGVHYGNPTDFTFEWVS